MKKMEYRYDIPQNTCSNGLEWLAKRLPPEQKAEREQMLQDAAAMRTAVSGKTVTCFFEFSKDE